MKTTTLVLALAAALAGCSKGTSKATTVPPAPVTTTTKQPEPVKPPVDVTADQPVSPGLAVSSDIAAACNLKVAAAGANPKFDYDKDELTEEDRQVLSQIATCLTTGALKGKAVSLIGRADPRGTDEYNLGLGSRRAHSVSQYLGRLGVTAPQMAVTTRGSLDAAGTDEATWREDRRVDIQLQQPAS
jgi:peptidoglycan-associated lipoprotein